MMKELFNDDLTDTIMKLIEPIGVRVDDVKARTTGLEVKVSQQGNVLSETFEATKATRRYGQKTRSDHNKLGMAYADLKARVERLENQMALLGTPTPPLMIWTSGGTYTPPGDGDHGADDDDEPWWTGMWVCRGCNERVAVGKTDDVVAPTWRRDSIVGDCPACGQLVAFRRPDTTSEPSPAPDEAVRRTRVAQWLMDQFDGDQHLSASGHTIAVRNHPDRDTWFKAADEVIGLAASADRSVVVTDADLVRTFNDAANDDTDLHGCDPEIDPDCVYNGTLAGIRAVRAALRAAERAEVTERPRVVCLCGSGRFREAFEQAEFDETLAGRIVLTIGCNTKDIARDVDWSHVKPMLDDLHLRKIDLADEVLILNVDGYIGESTARELAYAESLGKPIRYWRAAERGEGDRGELRTLVMPNVVQAANAHEMMLNRREAYHLIDAVIQALTEAGALLPDVPDGVGSIHAYRFAVGWEATALYDDGRECVGQHQDFSAALADALSAKGGADGE